MEKIIAIGLIGSILLFILSALSSILKISIIYLVEVMNMSLTIATIFMIVVIAIEMRIIFIIIKHYIKNKENKKQDKTWTRV